MSASKAIVRHNSNCKSFSRVKSFTSHFARVFRSWRRSQARVSTTCFTSEIEFPSTEEGALVVVVVVAVVVVVVVLGSGNVPLITEIRDPFSSSAKRCTRPVPSGASNSGRTRPCSSSTYSLSLYTNSTPTMELVGCIKVMSVSSRSFERDVVVIA